MSATAEDGQAVRLACKPNRKGDSLVFPYDIVNGSGVDIYAMDAMPRFDPATGTASADHDSVTVALAPDGFAHVLKGIAPLPRSKQVAVRAIPLAARIPPGATLERTLSLGQPLHETSPYHPDLPVREYRQAEIGGIVLTVHYIPANAPGFGALPAEFAPELYRIAAPNLLSTVKTISCRMPARGLWILQRTDDFPRPE